MEKTTYYIQAGAFKAQCLDLMNQVNDKHISITITKHGKPVAKLVPIETGAVDFFGCLQNTVTIKGDITKPVEVEWEANQ
jgi:prevent-host-death family protein